MIETEALRTEEMGRDKEMGQRQRGERELKCVWYWDKEALKHLVGSERLHRVAGSDILDAHLGLLHSGAHQAVCPPPPTYLQLLSKEATRCGLPPIGGWAPYVKY